MGHRPAVTLRHLSGAPHQPLLVVGPSLGTTVDRLWGPVAESLAGWHVVGWDLPGHGHSPEADRLAGDFELSDLATAVLAGVADLAGPDATFAWAGDSVGGAVGLLMALDRPERVSRIAVLCSAAVFGTPEAWLERAALVRAEGMAPMVASSPARWFGTTIRESADERIPPLLADLGEVDPQGYAQVCEALARYDVRDRLTTLQPPLLAVAGADDVATPRASLAEISEAVPDGRLEVLPGVGHLAPYEDPGGTAALLRAFLAG